MYDTYTPPAPGAALCPHCQAAIADAITLSHGIRLAYLDWRCPSCGRGWYEIRTATEVRRYWEAAS